MLINNESKVTWLVPKPEVFSISSFPYGFLYTHPILSLSVHAAPSPPNILLSSALLISLYHTIEIKLRLFFFSESPKLQRMSPAVKGKQYLQTCFASNFFIINPICSLCLKPNPSAGSPWLTFIWDSFPFQTLSYSYDYYRN